jgi:hypothetical protein
MWWGGAKLEAEQQGSAKQEQQDAAPAASASDGAEEASGEGEAAFEVVLYDVSILSATQYCRESRTSLLIP